MSNQKTQTLILPESGYNKDHLSIVTVGESVTVGVKVNGITNDIVITLDQLRQFNEFTLKFLKKWTS